MLTIERCHERDGTDIEPEAILTLLASLAISNRLFTFLLNAIQHASFYSTISYMVRMNSYIRLSELLQP